DVNLNRAREGLRVVEEICRFHMNDQKYFLRLKELRHRLKEAETHFALTPVLFRAAESDVGKEPHPLEKKRRDLKGLLTANCKRVEEGLRVLEEFSKFYGDWGDIFKTTRFAMYELEKELVLKLPGFVDYSLYLITDDIFLGNPDIFVVIEDCIKAGVTVLQYRAKNKTGREMLKECEKLKDLTGRYSIPFIVNDRLDLALAVDADGVHLGQDDLPFETAKKYMGDRIIGISATSYQEGQEVIIKEADYIGFGPIFATPTKKDANPPCGTGTLSRLKFEFPDARIVAIGGIDLNNAVEVIKAGADGLAVISAILGSANPAETVKKFGALLRQRIM
ncbi:MAG: thiamine phosphate synthase, partial [Eubacteriales bacterium]